MMDDYISYNIHFMEIGREEIHSDRYYYMNDSTAYSDLRFENNHSDAVDIYFLSPTSSYYSAQKVPSDNFLLGGVNLGTSIISHEMGHCLGLYHTHRGSPTPGCQEDGGFQEKYDESNCAECGDLVCDTPADPCLRLYVDVNCQYTGPDEYNPDVHNIMSYAPPSCLSHFTQGQIDRIFYMMEHNDMVRGFLESYKIAVTVDQKSSSGNSIGNIYHWENAWQEYTPPYTFYWQNNSHQMIKADTNIFNDEKFKLFQDDFYIVYHEFEITNGDSIISHFKPVSSVCVKAKNISGLTGGQFQFKDPWLRDTVETTYGLRNRGTEAIFHSYDSTLTLSLDSDHQGVFLDQGYSQGNWSLPYYEVKAKDQQPFTAHNETITGYFLNWEGHDVSYQNADQLQTPVAFHTANSEARAVYKGHLCSNVQNATATNNARKFAKTDDGKLHWIYVDDQSVFYTYSTDNGQTWAKETCLARKDDDAQVYFIAPSIAKYGNEIYVAYIEVYSGSGFSDIWEQHINYGAQNPQWSTRLGVNTIFTEDSNAVTSATFIQRDDGSGTVFPLIAVGYTMDNEKYLEVYKKENDEYSSVLNLTNCSYPSLSADTYHAVNSQQIALAYESQDQIFLRTAYWDNGVLTWGGEEQVSNDDDTYSVQSHPNVSAMNGYCHVVWSAYNTEDQKNEVLYRMYMPGSSGNTISSAAPPGNLVPYGTVTEIKSSDYSVYNPSVTALEDQTAYIFYDKNGGIYRKHFVNQNYHGVSYFGSGHYPSACDHVSQGTGWMHYDDAPFVLRTDVNGPSNAIPIEPVNPNWGAINMKLSADTNGGQEGHIIIRFYDFTYGQDTLQMNQALRTDSMNISGDNVPLTMNLEVVFKNVINRPADEDLIYTLNFVDNGDTINLTPLKYGDLPNNPSPNGERFFKLTTIVNLGNRGGKFVMKLADSGALVYRIIKTDESQSNPKVKLPSQVIPKTFALHQNFPNPFNPVTHITVDLPEDAKVHLSVYNVNGQKVKELMSGYKAAGTYEIIFDGKNLASGVYIYRLTTDKGFVQSKKMMLIR